MKANYLNFMLIGLILMGCHARHVEQDQDTELNGKQFFVTHENRVKSGKDFALEKSRKQTVTHKKSAQIAQDRMQTASPKKFIRTTQDGAPAGPLPSFFAKITAKREPISRYGNPDTYQVQGKKYEVMTNSKGYKRRGIASWYGTKFHTGRTSSGEKYDMYALTAAHKTLPLPTYVKVRNLNNGKEAIVKVNDRGPFHANRILDLSYAAAVKLGLLPKGTAPVEVEALKTTQHSLHYFVQAGAFESHQLAKALSAKLGGLTSTPIQIQRYKKKFIVQVGPIANKDLANRVKSQLEKNHIHGVFSILM